MKRKNVQYVPAALESLVQIRMTIEKALRYAHTEISSFVTIEVEQKWKNALDANRFYFYDCW